MKKVYTCYVCSFPFIREEEDCPTRCPSCNALSSNFLSEPLNGGIENRRIHVDPPKPDPNWDPMDISFHYPKNFKPHSMHGRIRRFVLGYEDAEATRKFYSEVFDWDIINVEHTDPQKPLMFCATGPGTTKWEPKFPSFAYGFLKSRETEDTGTDPRFLVEVDNIEDTLAAAQKYGGKAVKSRYEVDNQSYAVAEDCEGNAMYLWETPSTVTWDEPETKYLSERPSQEEFDRVSRAKRPQKTDSYPFRAPKSYPNRDLHGRTRYMNIYYRNFKRFQAFYVNVLGWDMIELPLPCGGEEPGGERPSVIIATGPSYEDYEGVVPGHMNACAYYAPGELPKPTMLMEIHTGRPVIETVNDIIAHGGEIVSAIPSVEDGWGNYVSIKDLSGNVIQLWGPSGKSRLWDVTQPETGYDRGDE